MRAVRTLRLAVTALAAVLLLGVAPPPAQTLYQSMFVVSGKSPERRVVGFEEALRRLMVKISGDRRLADDPAVESMIQHAGDYVVDFSYLDLKQGIKLSDEQGSYDRPHYLTVTFDQEKIDAALAGLGRKPWTGARPKLVIFLGVHRDPRSYVVDGDDARDEAMRQSAGNASLLYSMPIVFPPKATLPPAFSTFDQAKSADPADLEAAAKAAGGDAALVGTLDWSDADLGWIADWTIAYRGKPVHWRKKGISFDDAFCDGLSGAALTLSGSGTP
ncbi:MAG: DUF2066 domain-containing protein [Bauldia sp.]